jgi:hypothetical protein
MPSIFETCRQNSTNTANWEVQMQNGQVVNNETGKRIPVEKYLKGDLASIQ